MKIPYKGLAVVGAVTAGAAAVNAVIGSSSGELESLIGGHERTYRWRFGDIFYTVAGEGEPVLFVHGIGAGASSYEWRSNFMALSNRFTVYAIDLLGFGLSDRPALKYNSELFVQLIVDFILDVIGRPTGIAASSHASAYAVLAAEKHKPMIHHLVLSCPTGIGIADERKSMLPSLGLALSLPVFGQSAYYTFTSRRSIERYLKSQVYADPESVIPEVVDHYYVSTHQPGASRPIRAFIAGDLNVNIRNEFARLSQPVALVWGRESKITPPENSVEFVSANLEARVEILDRAAQLPHEERPDLYNELLQDVFSLPREGVTVK
jgi:pimeloyl-ACP methyl ester carboxylesterase